jgi:Rv2525c-like, glycoside hydrolase-like domain
MQSNFPGKSAGALLLAFAVLLTCCNLDAQENRRSEFYLGFDRNDYPGDANLKTLRQTFSYAGYWLNNPPGATTNSWAGHRAAVESAGFGFLVLFNGRLYAELKNVANATKLGQSDAEAAVSAARREGFPAKAVIFLDQEQGGRMLPEQKAYIYAWVDDVIAAGFRAGIYCSGIAAKDDGNVVTVEDIRQNAGGRDIAYWAINDACPPAPGCAFPQRPPNPAQSGMTFAEVWQFAQSPRRKDVAAHCTNYSRDGNCYAPGTGPAQGLYIDVNTATSPDPSHGRTR